MTHQDVAIWNDMSKTALGKIARKAADQQALAPVSNYIKTNIVAGQASAAPPLGPMLGQRGVNVAKFCQEFNQKTAHIIDGVPLPTRVTVNPDRSYSMTIQTPTTSWLLMRAAGVTRGSMIPMNEFCGIVTWKHVYEIAKIKSQDEIQVGVTMKDLCMQVVGTARRSGIKVVKDLTPEEYSKFLKERAEIVRRQLEELEEKKLAKVSRAV